MEYLLFFHYNNGCMNATNCYVYMYMALLFDIAFNMYMNTYVYIYICALSLVLMYVC
jgi:hypothetical protein